MNKNPEERKVYAALALQGLLSNPEIFGCAADDYVSDAVSYADYLVKKLAQSTSNPMSEVITAGSVIEINLPEQFEGQTLSLTVSAVWRDTKTKTIKIYFDTPDIDLLDTNLDCKVTLRSGFYLNGNQECDAWLLQGDFVRDAGIYYLSHINVNKHSISST